MFIIVEIVDLQGRIPSGEERARSEARRGRAPGVAPWIPAGTFPRYSISIGTFPLPNATLRQLHLITRLAWLSVVCFAGQSFSASGYASPWRETDRQAWSKQTWKYSHTLLSYCQESNYCNFVPEINIVDIVPNISQGANSSPISMVIM